MTQNICVCAARRAGVRPRAWEGAGGNEALTASMTHKLEADFDFFGHEPLPLHTPQEAAAILVRLAQQHDFTFYKYQIPDLVSHTGQVELARQVFEVIQDFVEAILRKIRPAATILVITSDHGHL